MSMLDRIRVQLVSVGQMLKLALDESTIDTLYNRSWRAELHDSTHQVERLMDDNSPAFLQQMSVETDEHFNSSDANPLSESLDRLYKNINRIGILSEITKDVKGKYQLGDVVEAILDAFWKRSSLRFAVLVLGRTELGPYYYAGMRGTPTPWLHLLHECPFPLSGVLAETILLRREPDEPDYVHIADLASPNRLSRDEFPWLPKKGSLLMVPLRSDGQVFGALMLGGSSVGAFDDMNQSRDFCDIASIAAEAIYQAQMHQEVNSSAEKLVNVQLITRKLSLVETYRGLVSILTQTLPEVSSQISVQLLLHENFQALDSTRYLSPIDTDQPLGEQQNKLVMVQAGLSLQEQPLPLQVMELAQWSLKAGQPLFYDLEKLEAQPEHAIYSDVGAAAIVPITDKHHMYGVLHVMAKSKYNYLDESDMVVFRSIANGTAMALAKLSADQAQERSILSAMQSLVGLVESRFPMLQGHSARTAHNAALLAQKLGVDEAKAMQIRVAASLHDVGMTQPTSDIPFPADSGAEQLVSSTTAKSLRVSHQMLHDVGIHQSITGLVAGFAIYLETTEAKNLMRVSLNETEKIALRKSSEEVTERYAVSNSTNHAEESLQRGKYREPFDEPSIESDSKINQIVAIVDALDTFLIRAVFDRQPSTGLALAFLQQAKVDFSSPSLINSLQSLIEQELILLP